MEPIRSYLKDIKPIPLLTAKQEIELGRRIQKGDARAERQMTLSNLRLVINIAKRYAHLGVPLLDLIEEGNLGLMKAVVKYNPEKGFRFSTYGAWWIRQYITRAIANQGKTVRIPVYMTELLSKYKRITERLTQKFGRKPTTREIARRMQLPIERVERLKELVTSSQITSLDTPIGEDGETEMIDLIQSDPSHNPHENVLKFLQHERIQALLRRMGERECRVLVLRYGLDDGISRTLGETAKFFGITRERVRQIEVAAMKKLRAMITAEEANQPLPDVSSQAGKPKSAIPRPPPGKRGKPNAKHRKRMKWPAAKKRGRAAHKI